MKILKGLIQGSPEWHAHRTTARNASEAPIMLGLSKKTSRDEMLSVRVTGIYQEVSEWVQRNLFDKGHEAEAAARPNAETILRDTLYPVTAMSDDGYLSASFDGITACGSVFWENKMFNQELAAFIEASNDLPDTHWPQVEQQYIVSCADRCLFTLSDEQGNIKAQLEYLSDPERRKMVLAGWKQFDVDAETHKPAEYLPAPEAKAIKELPALHITLVGQVRNSNLIEYRQTAMAFVESINTTLETDQDFADAEKTIKFCDSAEKELEVVKKAALGQTADIAELFRNVDELRDAMKAKRLELDKLVKARKEAIRVKVVQDRITELNAHIAALNSELSRGIRLPVIHADFAGAIKGKKTIKSLHESANEELARAKIEATQIAERYRQNLSILDDFASDHLFLFNDLPAVISKPADDFELLVVSRVNQHKAAEAARLEAETKRIEAETTARLQREAEAKAKAELEAANKAAAEAAQKAVSAASVEVITRPAPNVEFASEPFCGGTLNRPVQVTQTAPTPDQATALEFAAEAAPERLSGVPDSHEGDIMNWLYSQEKIYGEQGHRIARALMSGRVPHMKYLAEAEAKSA